MYRTFLWHFVRYGYGYGHGLHVGMTDFDDIELAGLTEAELEELSEFIDPDVSLHHITTQPAGICIPKYF